MTKICFNNHLSKRSRDESPLYGTAVPPSLPIAGARQLFVLVLLIKCDINRHIHLIHKVFLQILFVSICSLSYLYTQILLKYFWMANLYVRATPTTDLNRNTEWFTYPGVWTIYIFILLFSWLVVLSVFGSSYGMAWTIVNLSHFIVRSIFQLSAFMI